MSVLIKKMEMPKGCWACPFAVGKHYECLFTKKSYNWGLTTRPSDCPLIEVPPHGDLIDKEEALKRVRAREHGICTDGVDVGFNLGIDCAFNLLKTQNTIIEAEGSE